MKKIILLSPWILLYSRLVIALYFFIILGFPTHAVDHRVWIVSLFCFGFIGDIFDGIIARKLNSDTTLLRRLDSLFDSFFWVASTCLLYQLMNGQLSGVFYGLSALIGFVGIEYAFCLIRFGKSPSTHNFLSKFFGLFLFILYVLLFVGYQPSHFGFFVLLFGFLARLDSLSIYIILNTWTHDIPSSYHAVLINKNIDFKRNSLFHSTEN